MQIVLVRHGQTEWNKEGRFQGIVDIPLNEIGKQEARFASNLLKQKKWDVVISSPLQRARETASIINEQLDCNSLVMEEFIEQSFGDAEGLFYEEVNLKYGENKLIPNIEPIEQVSKRIQIGLNKVAQLPYERVIIVSHGIAINEIICLIEHGKSNAKFYTLNNCGVTSIQFEEGVWKVNQINEINHLKQTIN